MQADFKYSQLTRNPSSHLIASASHIFLCPVANRYCLVPCGTCDYDYISLEILQAHEEALVALEMDDDEHEAISNGQVEREGYGVETDRWSLGAMLYEMAYGVAPFFAYDIKQTYIRIMNHEVCFPPHKLQEAMIDRKSVV